MAKSRIAPIKTLKMPRVVSNAAVIGLKFFNLIIHEIDLPKEKVKIWWDTMLTLQYIQGQSHRFRIYASNGVSQVLEKTWSNDCNFLEGVMNPSDECSREVIHPTQLLETDKYWRN